MITAGMLMGKELTEKADGIVPGKAHPHHRRLLSRPGHFPQGTPPAPPLAVFPFPAKCSDLVVSRY